MVHIFVTETFTTIQTHLQIIQLNKRKEAIVFRLPSLISTIESSFIKANLIVSYLKKVDISEEQKHDLNQFQTIYHVSVLHFDVLAFARIPNVASGYALIHLNQIKKLLSREGEILILNILYPIVVLIYLMLFV